MLQIKTLYRYHRVFPWFLNYCYDELYSDTNPRLHIYEQPYLDSLKIIKADKIKSSHPEDVLRNIHCSWVHAWFLWVTGVTSMWAQGEHMCEECWGNENIITQYSMNIRTFYRARTESIALRSKVNFSQNLILEVKYFSNQWKTFIVLKVRVSVYM